MTASPRIHTPNVVVAVAVVAAWAVGAGALAAAAAPSPPPSTTAPATTAVATLPGGAFTAPDNSYEVRFSATPTVVTEPDGLSTSYLVGVEEDSETLSVLAPTAFGATADASAAERVQLFLDASGDEIDVRANSSTRLGPFPAAYFASGILLDGGRRAVLYGAAVIRPADVSYVFYTDVGGDDADRGRAFVESYAVLIDPYPAPPPAERWAVQFTDPVALRASSEGGFAFADYTATSGDDAQSVRVTELPATFMWSAAGAAAQDASRVGGRVVVSTLTSVDGAPGARFTLEDDGASGVTTEVVLVRDRGQLYRVAYRDGGDSSADAAAAFVDSFQLAPGGPVGHRAPQIHSAARRSSSVGRAFHS